MFLPGLVSITFRQLSVAETIALVTQAGLAAVEWGGDIHAPHGDEAQARAIARMGADAGLRVAAYGSYYRVGHPETGPFRGGAGLGGGAGRAVDSRMGRTPGQRQRGRELLSEDSGR